MGRVPKSTVIVSWIVLYKMTSLFMSRASEHGMITPQTHLSIPYQECLLLNEFRHLLDCTRSCESGDTVAIKSAVFYIVRCLGSDIFVGRTSPTSSMREVFSRDVSLMHIQVMLPDDPISMKPNHWAVHSMSASNIIDIIGGIWDTDGR